MAEAKRPTGEPHPAQVPQRSTTPTSERTPLSRSAVVPAQSPSEQPAPESGGARKRRDQDPPSFRNLTPYQARLDVDMDDTAISRVRDPSASFRLGLDGSIDPSTRASRPRRTRPRRHALFPVLLGCAFGVTLVIIFILALPDAQQATGLSAPSAVAPVPQPSARRASSTEGRKIAACRVSVPPLRLSRRAFADVTPALDVGLEPRRVAVAYARSRSHAVGLLLDPTTLDAERVFEWQRSEPMNRIIPSDVMGQFAHSMHRGESNSPKFFTAPALSVEVSRGTLIRRAPGGGQSVLYPKLTNALGPVQVAAMGDRGYALALRSENGELLVGYLGPGGEPRGELFKTSLAAPMEPPELGTDPSGSLLVIVPVRGDASRLWITKASFGTAPAAAHPLWMPAAPSGAPAVAALPGGAWLMQQVVVASGSRTLVAITLDADLRATGSPAVVSPPGRDVIQGGVGFQGGRAVSVYTVGPEAASELWAATLQCG